MFLDGVFHFVLVNRIKLKPWACFEKECDLTLSSSSAISCPTSSARTDRQLRLKSSDLKGSICHHFSSGSGSSSNFTCKPFVSFSSRESIVHTLDGTEKKKIMLDGYQKY